MSTRSIAIVGASLAGTRAAQALRVRGFDGRVTLIGAELHPPYDRPPLSKQVLAGTRTLEDTLLHPQEHWSEQDIELELGQSVVALHPARAEVELADGRAIPADKVLLCTGGRPRTLDVGGADLPGVHCLRTIDDARDIRSRLVPGARVVVVGAGFVGAEVAASARSLGCDVTLIEVAPVPLWRVLGAELGRFYGQVHRDHGVRVLTGVGIDELVGDATVRQVVLGNGAIIPADVVVVGVGITPSIELAATSGAAVGNGILVDEFCETTVPDVYAAGDVANHPSAILGERVRLEHWQNAQNQGAAAASSMLGHREPFREVPWFWSDQYGMRLQMAGHPRADDHIVYRGEVGEAGFSAFYLRDGIVRAVLGINRPRDVRVGLDLIAARAPMAAGTIADESSDLRALARAAKQAAAVTRAGARA